MVGSLGTSSNQKPDSLPKVGSSLQYVGSAYLTNISGSIVSIVKFVFNSLKMQPTHLDQCDTVQKLYQTAYKISPEMLNMNQVLQVDSRRCLVHVQRFTSFRDVLHETLKAGLRPKFVPLLCGTTLKDAFEKPYKFQNCVAEVEVLNKNGQIVTYSKGNFFEIIPEGSFILSSKIKLIAVQPYVAMTYVKYGERFDFLAGLEAEALNEDQAAFVEGVIFSNHEMVLVKGVETDKPPPTLESHYNQIFSRSILHKLSDHLSIGQYFSRWDHRTFWLNEDSFWKRVTKSLHRFVIAPFSPEQPDQLSLIEEVFPFRNCEQVLKYLQGGQESFPIYLCPLHIEGRKELLCYLVAKASISRSRFFILNRSLIRSSVVFCSNNSLALLYARKMEELNG